MQNLRLRWPIVLISLLATVAVLFVGRLGYQLHWEDQPLKTVLGEIPVVESYTVSRGGPARVVAVQFKEVSDLPTAYRQVAQRLDQVVGKGRYDLVVQDKRSPALGDAWYKVHLLLQEAIATGRFTVINERIDSVVSGLGLTRHRVFVDSDKVFVQLHSRDGYLYEVVARPQAPGKVKEGGD